MEQKPVKIYSSVNTPRLAYIAEIILHDILGLSWEIITDKRKIGKNPVINYTHGNIPASLKISPDALLFEEGIRPVDIDVSEFMGIPVFFRCSPDSDFQFDIFAASFYLISRYEEYQECRPGKTVRFHPSESIAGRHGFLGVSIIETWAKMLAKALAVRFINMAFRPGDFRAVASFNINDPLTDHGRNIFGNIAGLLRDIAGRKVHEDLNGPDRIESFGILSYFTRALTEHNTDSLFFFPVSDQARQEKGPSWKNTDYRKIICVIYDSYKTGIYSSGASIPSASVEKEIGRMKKITGKDIFINRFNASDIVMPDSYSKITDLDIKQDYSMGYPDQPGFRAGISRPFMFYDLYREQMTRLQIFPFQLTDQALRKMLEKGVQSAKNVITGIITEISRAGGIFVSVWNDDTFRDESSSGIWKEIFEFTLGMQNQ